MSSSDQLVLWVGALTATATLVAAFVGAAFAGTVERRRRQRGAMQDMRRQLWRLREALDGEATANHLEVDAHSREVDRLLDEIDLHIADLPRRVGRVVEQGYEIVNERCAINGLAAKTTAWELSDLLRETLNEARLGPTRWQRADVPDPMRDYLARLNDLYDHRAALIQRELEAERRRPPELAQPEHAARLEAELAEQRRRRKRLKIDRDERGRNPDVVGGEG